MIPFDSNSGASRDPRRFPSDPLAHGRSIRGGTDEVLLRELEERRSRSSPAQRLSSLAGWLVAPLCLAATLATALFLLRGPDPVFGVVFGAVLGLGLLWILVSSLFPAQADRRCSQCGRDALVRLDPHSAQGLRCRMCGFSDATASSFLLAEEDGAELEDIALRERGRSRRRF